MHFSFFPLFFPFILCWFFVDSLIIYNFCHDENKSRTGPLNSCTQVVLFDHFIRFWANKEDSAQSEEKLPLGPDSKDGSSTSTDRGLDLYDNVTAAIYEDDLLEIARNALGGTLHQEHQGEWVPADILMDDELERGRLGGRGPDDPSAPANSLETSVLGTMKGLYDAHKNDISFGTLGNFTFIQVKRSQ